MKSETKNCQNCKKDFIIEPDDFLFYEKIKVPPPTWCPECRMIRRLSHRNERTLFHRTCDMCGQNIISIYNSHHPFKIYCRECFYGDNWDQLGSGMFYDFSRPFFEQYKELQIKAPRLANQQSNNIINSDYSNHCSDLKNCYLIFASVHDEDCYYCNSVSHSKWVFDGLRVFKSESCYECIDCLSCQGLKYSELCSNSFDGSFLFNCKNCSNCFMCSNLVNQSYCIRNIKYTKEEYISILKSLEFGSIKKITSLLKEFEELKIKSIHSFMEGFNHQNSSGNYLKNTKNCHFCFDITDGEDLKYIGYGNEVKDCMDCYATYPKTELCYESAATGDPSYNCHFSYLPWGSSNIYYSNFVFNGSNCFGCIQLNKKSYCILNKQYTKEEYDELVPKIIKHMSDMPYTDRKGRVYKYGEFFPIEISPFSYNESIAQQYFPIDEVLAKDNGCNWGEEVDRNYKITIKSNELPDMIENVNYSIINEIIECKHAGECNQQCTIAFKITEDELVFYKKMNIPLPTLCYNCRHYERLKKRNPMKLWDRKCIKCNKDIKTSYAPERPEIVYCEECYKKEIY